MTADLLPPVKGHDTKLETVLKKSAHHMTGGHGQTVMGALVKSLVVTMKMNELAGK